MSRNLEVNGRAGENSTVTRGVVAASPDMQPSLAGQTLGRYLVLGLLGRGGGGTVYEAFDTSLDRQVAVKVLCREPSSSDTERLIREAKALARLSHPNVVQVYEVGNSLGQTFIAMELVHGKTLRQWQRQDPVPSWRACVRMYCQAGAGLVAAHTRGLVHRDFKPSNVMIDGDGRVRVLDFGLARAADGRGTGVNPDLFGSWTQGSQEGSGPGIATGGYNARLTEAGATVGTPGYMPLEQMQGRNVDARSDQFSFCVALYEAVYGRRPFSGRTLEDLEQDFHARQPLIAPDRKGVPTRLHELLARGLALEPEQRWPTMDRLLEQLERLIAPRRYPMGIAVVAGLSLVGAGLAYQAERDYQSEQTEREQRCTGAAAQLDEIWDDERRKHIQDAILGTRISYAQNTWDRVQADLDNYASAWTERHTAACEATAVTQEQSEQALELRMDCLRARRAAMHAAIKVLADADTEVVREAAGMVAALPSVTTCDDVEFLRAQQQRVPPPSDPQMALEVDALRQRLADLDAERHAGRYARAIESFGAVMKQIEALGYLPLQAEAERLLGWTLADNGNYDEAEQQLSSSYKLAVRQGHDSVALDAASNLTFVVGSRQARHAEGIVWGATALPLAERMGVEVKVAAVRLNLSSVLRLQHQDEAAEQHQREALEIWERVLGSDHPHVAVAYKSLGNTLFNQGRYHEALPNYRRALAINEIALGPGHPMVAKDLNNIGVVVSTLGEHEQAEDHHRRALQIEEQTLRVGHPKIAATLTNLGNALYSQGKLEAAERFYQRAMETRAKELGADHPTLVPSLLNLGNALYSQGKDEEAEAQYRRALHLAQSGPDKNLLAISMIMNNLGSILGDRQHQYEEAESMYRRALEIGEQLLGTEHPDVGTAAANLASSLYHQGKYDEAERLYRRALNNIESSLGSEQDKLSTPLTGLANVSLARGEHEAARVLAERALSIQEATQASPKRMAFVRFVLAQSLWPDRRERARARRLAIEAQEAFTAAGTDYEAQRAEVDRWLAAHRQE